MGACDERPFNLAPFFKGPKGEKGEGTAEAIEAAEAAKQAAQASQEALEQFNAQLLSGISHVVGSIAELKLVDPAKYQVVYVVSYWQGAGIGGGMFVKSNKSRLADGGMFISGLNNVLWERVLTSPLTVFDYGAGKDATATSYTAFANAIAYLASLPNGGTLTVPYFKLATDKTIEIPRNVSIEFQGGGLQAVSPVQSLLLITGGMSKVIGGNFSNQDKLANVAIGVTKGWDNSPVLIKGNYAAEFQYAVQWNEGDRATIEDNFFVLNETHVMSHNNFMNSSIHHNFMLGGKGISLNKEVADGSKGAPEGIDITSNKILNGGTTVGSFAVRLTSGLEVLIADNVLDQMVDGSAILLDALTNTINSTKIRNNWIGRQLGATNAQYGVYAVGNITGLFLKGNTYAGWQQHGVYTNGANSVVADFRAEDEYFYHADPCANDMQLNHSQRALISKCVFNSAGSSITEGPGVDGRVDFCTFNKAKPPQIRGGLKYGKQLGLSLDSRDDIVIEAAGAAIQVFHGLSYAPNLNEIQVTLGTIPQNDIQGLQVVNIDQSSFTITPRSAPGNNIRVGWKADITR